MWNILVRLILRNRPGILVVIGLITILMAWQGLGVKLSYDMVRMLPSTDSAVIDYDAFKKRFGEDGSVLVIGVKNPGMFVLDELNAWYDLTTDMGKIGGVAGVMSITKAANIVKNDSLRKFEFLPLIPEKPTTQSQADSLKNKIHSLKFYEGLLYNSESNAYLLAVTLDKTKLNDKSRLTVTDNIVKRAKAYSEKTGHELHYSGLPYIRSVMTRKIKSELFLFIFLSIGIAAIILFLFFRSYKVVLSSLVVVAISIVFTLGLIGLFGYKISILTGVIPSLIVVIAIENCIYILNKYHWEYRQHGNKIKALSRVVQRIGFASLMVNTATAAGFAAFILVSNQLLREFGIIASISIMLEYLLCILLLPIIFSYMKPPTEKHLAHLDNRIFGKVLDKIIYFIQFKRKIIFSIAGLSLVAGIIGMMMMKTSGKVVDDISESNVLYKDLKFFEREFGGVMPFEISIDTKKKKGVMKLSTMEKIDELQTEILKNKEFSKPLSVAELAKFAKQAYFNGNPDMYEMPNSQERNFVFSYFPQKAAGQKGLLNSFIDSTQQFTRVSFQMADIGTKEMNRLLDSIRPKVAEIFPADKYDVNITGNSVVYTRGTEFLIKHLFESVLIAIGFISLLMALMFSSARMIAVSMLPNIIPLIITAAIMGFVGVPVKPSTIIVFSIALGISVDNAIQYLSRYRHELKITGNDIKLSTINALREAGFSMIYTSIVLVLGFSVFMVSSFGGTKALGMLVSTTLFIAMFFNIMVLPSLLLVLDKYLVTKAFASEPLIEIYDGEDVENEQEEDIEDIK
ncbi:MAG: MMPL family transporter [Bacteroidales bacterium]|nr:MMPL family transporter [Bacteroidales bacterium]MBK9358094.1 MMPL family transporter [Bacteroidales bacterium]